MTIKNKYSKLFITLIVILSSIPFVLGADCIGEDCESNMTIVITDTTPPTWENPRNFTHEVNTSFSEAFNASDVGGISYYWLNDTTIFNISQIGTITNVSALSNISIHYINVSVNDTAGNIASIIIWINVTLPSITLTISSPTNTTYNYVDVDLLVSTTGIIDTHWYKLNSGNNITFIPNITLNNLEWEQYHTIQVWVNNSEGNIVTEIRRFYIGDIRTNYLMYYLLVLVLGGLLLLLGCEREDPILMILEGFLFSAFSITYAIKGYPTIDSEFLNIVIITISSGFAFYLMAIGSLQLVEDRT